MHFALGKAYESNRQFDKSFKHYTEGNWQQRKQISYNAEDYKISIDEMIEIQLNFIIFYFIDFGYLYKYCFR